MSYNKFKEELQRRIEERRRQKSNTWFNLIIRILALIFVIMIIRYFGSIRAKKMELMEKQYQQYKSNTELESHPEKPLLKEEDN